MGDWEDSELLSEEALDRITKAPRLPVIAPIVEQRALGAALELIAHRVVFRAFEGQALSKRFDLEPMLKWWARMHSKPETARANLQRLTERARGKGSSPMPPLDYNGGTDFERWLADASLAHEVDPGLLEHLSATALAQAREKKERVAKNFPNLRAAREAAILPSVSYDVRAGGRRKNHQESQCLEKLLAVFWLMYREEPKASIACKRPRAPGTSMAPAGIADGGSAARFVFQFYSEVGRFLDDRMITDPLRRKNPRSRSWEAPQTVHSVAQRIDELLLTRTRPWLRWDLIGRQPGGDAVEELGAELVRPVRNPTRR